MDKASNVVFNNQAVEGGVGQPALTHTHSGAHAAPTYGQGRHQELLEAISTENYQQALNVLNSVPNPEQILNLMDNIFRQSAIYKVVLMPDPAKALEFARLFIAKGAIVLGKDIHGQSPLFYICKEGRIELLKLLLENKADINETDNFRQTPIFYAARDGKTDMVRTMLEHKANPNHKDKAEQTALFYAARDNRLETVKALVEGGANINVADGKKQTALYFARKMGNQAIDDYLVAEGAVNTKDGILRQVDMRKKPINGAFKSSQGQERGEHLGNQPPEGAPVH